VFLDGGHQRAVTKKGSDTATTRRQNHGSFCLFPLFLRKEGGGAALTSPLLRTGKGGKKKRERSENAESRRTWPSCIETRRG